MKRLSLAEAGRKEALAQGVNVIRAGGILLYPTDTVYGLGCDPLSARALEKLTKLKRRPVRRYYLVLIDRPGAVSGLVSELPESFSFFSHRLWPGPVSMIFPKEKGKAPFPENDSIGIRCPHWSFLRDFLELLEGPLISTSVNRSGEDPITDPDEAGRQFRLGVDLFLDFGKLPNTRPSTILDLRPDPPVILREGAMLRRVQDAIRDWKQGKR